MGFGIGLAIFGLLIGAGIGLFAGDAKYQEEKEDMQTKLDRDAERAGLEIDPDTGEWVPTGEGEIGAELAARERDVDLTGRKFASTMGDIDATLLEGMTENRAAAAEDYKQTGQSVLSAEQEREIVGGKAGASLAGSGVRKTGSASNILSENVRMYNTNIEEIDRQLDTRQEARGRERSSMRRVAASSKTSAALSFEERLESLTGKDVSEDDIGGLFADGADFDSGLNTFMESLDLTPTLLTDQYIMDFGFATEDIADLNKGDYQLAGALEGATWGFNLLK